MIQIWIQFYVLTWREKDAFKLASSLLWVKLYLVAWNSIIWFTLKRMVCYSVVCDTTNLIFAACSFFQCNRGKDLILHAFSDIGFLRIQTTTWKTRQTTFLFLILIRRDYSFIGGEFNISMQWWQRPDPSRRLSPSVPHPSIFRLFVKGKFDAYCISSYSVHGNYSFLNLEIQRSQYIRPKVTVHKGVETIQGWKLYEKIRYVWLNLKKNSSLPFY